MKRKFYQSYDSGAIEFDPPVKGQTRLLSDFLSAAKLQQLPTIDDEELVYRYYKAAHELYETERAIWDKSVPAEEREDDV